MKLLIFTDSRGQHKRGDHPLYFEKLQQLYNDIIDLYLCPYKWTTTPDFIELIQNGTIDPNNYDWIILHTGIVEWSPRPFSNALNDLYQPNNENISNLHNITLNTRDYNQKVRNLKKTTYDSIFGPENMQKHWDGRDTFDVIYENEPTINMYTVDMLQKYLLPILQNIPNLIWIGCNPILLDWNGTYFRKRPENINIVLNYSKILSQNLKHVINIQNWTETEIKKYTLDNIHLTQAGSDYIFNKIIEIIDKK